MPLVRFECSNSNLLFLVVAASFQSVGSSCCARVSSNSRLIAADLWVAASSLASALKKPARQKV